MSSCPYKDALGIPNEGIHAHRFLHLAIADVLMTLVAALLLTFLFFSISDARNFFVMFLVVAVTLFGLGIILHRAFCVRTTIDRLLFPSVR
jgi:hypothetical protein